ncbi:MAG: hypothetical protein ACK5LL_08845, partial [Suipraeoptans sp.]
VIMRVLEHLTEKTFSIKQIRESLTNYSSSYIDQNYYLFDYIDDVIKKMEQAFELDLRQKIMSLSDIKKVLKYQK